MLHLTEQGSDVGCSSFHSASLNKSVRSLNTRLIEDSVLYLAGRTGSVGLGPDTYTVFFPMSELERIGTPKFRIPPFPVVRTRAFKVKGKEESRLPVWRKLGSWKGCRQRIKQGKQAGRLRG